VSDIGDLVKKLFAEKMHLYIHGLDAVMNENDGCIYLFDCNYFSTYNDCNFKQKYGLNMEQLIRQHLAIL